MGCLWPVMLGRRAVQMSGTQSYDGRVALYAFPRAIQAAAGSQ